MILVLVAIGFTALALIIGIFFMAKGGALNERYSSKLMAYRVVFQAIAIVILAAIYSYSKIN